MILQEVKHETTDSQVGTRNVCSLEQWVVFERPLKNTTSAIFFFCL